MHYYTSFEEQDKIEHFRCCLRLRKKFSRIYFAVIWIFLLLVTIAFFFLSPTTKWLSKESAILDDIHYTDYCLFLDLSIHGTFFRKV